MLVIATGVSNGFWRRPDVESADQVAAGIDEAHRRLAEAGSIAVVGGGAAAVGTAWNAAHVWPDKRVDLYFPGEKGLPEHHRAVWARIERELAEAGVGIHPGHRAVVPPGFACDRITDDPVEWSTGQEPTTADAVLWAIGRTRPNTGWLPDRAPRRGRLRQGGARPRGARARRRVRDRRRGRDRPAALVGAELHVQAAGPQRARPPRRAQRSRPSTRRSGAGGRWSATRTTGWSSSRPRGRASGSRRLPADRMVRSLVVDRGYYRGVRR